MNLNIAQKQLLTHPLFDEQISLRLQLGLPWLQLDESRLVLGYYLHRQHYAADQLWFYPVQWEVKTAYPFRQIIYLAQKSQAGDMPLCHISGKIMLTQGKSLLQELYASADRLIALWEEGKALQEDFHDYQRRYRDTVKQLGLEALYGG